MGLRSNGQNAVEDAKIESRWSWSVGLQNVVLTSISDNSALNCLAVSSPVKRRANWSKEFNKVVIVANLMVHFHRLGEIIASDVTE